MYRLSLLLVLLNFSIISASPKTSSKKIILKDVKCRLFNNETLTFEKCLIETFENEKTGATLKFTPINDLKSIHIAAHFYTERHGNLKHLMTVNDINLCEIFSNTNGFKIPILNIFKDMVVTTGGNPPKQCPILKNIQYDMIGMTMDENSFPYLPITNFQLFYSFSINHFHQALTVNVSGEIVNRRRSRRKDRLG
ncbi:hypothetical protein ACFFRR_004090 [Megaselia abdita]